MPKNNHDSDSSLEDVGSAQLQAIVLRVIRQAKIADASENKQKTFREWLAVIISVLGMFATITYMAGGLGQRVSALEVGFNELRSDVMRKETLTEKFDGITLHLQSIDRFDEQVEHNMMGRK